MRCTVQAALKDTRVTQPEKGYFSFTFTGDGCGGQCPTSGCYQEDLNCEYCLAAWYGRGAVRSTGMARSWFGTAGCFVVVRRRSYPPDASYKYNPIVKHGCNGTKVDCPECEGMQGLSRYDE